MKLIILSMLVFAVIGPLVGLISFLVTTGTHNLPNGTVLVTYMVGGPMAIVAGLLFGIYVVTVMSKTRMRTWPATLIAGCISGGLSAFSLSVIFIGEPLDPKLFVTMGAVAGALCAMVYKALFLKNLNSV